MAYKWLRRIIGGLSFTSALFIFQACYGTPHDDMFDVLIEGQVTSSSTGMPIKDIKVYFAKETRYQLTDGDGRFSLYTVRDDSANVRFESFDSVRNDYYVLKDTVFELTSSHIILDVKLDCKE